MRKIKGGTTFAIKSLRGEKFAAKNLVGLTIQGKKNSKGKSSRLDEFAGWRLLVRKICGAKSLLWEELEGQTISDEKAGGRKIHDEKNL